jgi:allantoicase
VILKLGVPGTIHRIEVNTAHFKGNYPDSCSLDVCHAPGQSFDVANVNAAEWKEALPQTKLKANRRHVFSALRQAGPATHVRFQIYPDGGVSRLRLFGRPEVSEPLAKELDRLNRLSRKKAVPVFLDCCGSKQWATRMTDSRPFAAPAELFEKADAFWEGLGPKDRLEAFRHHPPIGGKRAAAKQSSKASRWSAKEQSTAQQASPETLALLAAENRAYSEQFGYVFLICATGKTSTEILDALRRRMPNDPAVELRIAAEEQRKIMRLRLEKLLAP